MITWFSKSRRQLPTQRSATPFCHGLRKAVRVGSLPMSLTAESTSCAWRIVISQATEHEQCYIPSLYVIHFKGCPNSGEGAESADHPTEEMSERCDTEWPGPIDGAQPSKNCACKFPRTQLKHCERLFQGDAALIRKDVGGEPCRGTRDGAGRGLLHSWNHLSHEGRNSECASP
jgi:hypothetical protein